MLFLDFLTGHFILERYNPSVSKTLIIGSGEGKRIHRDTVEFSESYPSESSWQSLLFVQKSSENVLCLKRDIPFFTLRAHKPFSILRHPCGRDKYLALLHWEEELMQIIWHARGPNKHFTVKTRYIKI